MQSIQKKFLSYILTLFVKKYGIAVIILLKLAKYLQKPRKFTPASANLHVALQLSLEIVLLEKNQQNHWNFRKIWPLMSLFFWKCGPWPHLGWSTLIYTMGRFSKPTDEIFWKPDIYNKYPIISLDRIDCLPSKITPWTLKLSSFNNDLVVALRGVVEELSDLGDRELREFSKNDEKFNFKEKEIFWKWFFSSVIFIN
jgi:hypothetical protein